MIAWVLYALAGVCAVLALALNYGPLGFAAAFLMVAAIHKAAWGALNK